jgi:hypothetical protein
MEAGIQARRIPNLQRPRAQRIGVAYGIPVDIGILVDSTCKAKWIFRDKSPGCAVVVSARLKYSMARCIIRVRQIPYRRAARLGIGDAEELVGGASDPERLLFLDRRW